MNCPLKWYGVKLTGLALAGWLISNMAMVGCNSPGDELRPRYANEVSEIKGGKETTGYPEVVAIYGLISEEEGGVLCTGTVIAPHVVLTAAHCVDPDVTGEVQDFKVLTGTHLIDEPCPCYDVAETHFHPDFSKDNLLDGNDIAVVITEEPMPIRPAPYMKSALTDDLVDQSVTLVGYGLTSGFNDDTAGVKREITIPLKEFDDQFVVTGNTFQGVCSGDSGGPVFMDFNGQRTVVGVNSFGFVYCLFSSRSTRVDAYVDFVAQYLDD